MARLDAEITRLEGRAVDVRVELDDLVVVPTVLI